jgi:hypothetical protein
MRAFCGVSCGGEIVSAVGTGECVLEKAISDVAFNTVRDDIGNLRVVVRRRYDEWLAPEQNA